jgi:hypothetical protein
LQAQSEEEQGKDQRGVRNIQKSKVGCLMRVSWDSRKKRKRQEAVRIAAGEIKSLSAEEEQRQTQCNGGKRQSGSREDGEDSKKVQATVKGTASTAKLGSINGEESDMQRE